MDKQCQRCKKYFSEESYHKTKVLKSGKILRKAQCNFCRTEMKKQYWELNPDIKQKVMQRQNIKRREDRRKEDNRAKIIYRDIKGSDKKHNRLNDLDIDWISNTIQQPCAYCLRHLNVLDMSLDRIDNQKGHVKDNILPCCNMCNYFRRNMPFEAWLLLIPGLKKAINLHLLDEWKFGITK